MVIALYMFALALIVGGAGVVAQGYGIVLNERGWTMVIAGTVAATGGFLLLGIATIAARLVRVEHELADLSQRAGRLDASALAPPRRTEPPIERPARGEAPSLLAAEEPAPGDTPERAVLRAAEVIPEPAPPEAAVEPETGPATAAPEALPDDAASAATEGSEQATPEAPEPEPPAPAVIGTYNSGGNSYVMFSDGSIEADTPSGRFRFASLDELKDFIAAGGEDANAARAS
jgi:hypothetical protein